MLSFLGQRCSPVSIRPTSGSCRPVAFATFAAYTVGIGVIKVLRSTVETWAEMFDSVISPPLMGQFLAPMAVSQGFGVLFASFFGLLLVPVSNIPPEDARKLFQRKKATG